MVRRDSHPWEFARVWHLEPSLDDPETLFAGVEDAALFKSVDGAETWTELSGLRTHIRGRVGSRAQGACASIPSSRSDRLRSTPRGHLGGRGVSQRRRWETWQPANRGLRSEGIPDPTPRSVTASTASRGTPSAPTCCSCRSTGT